MRLDQKVTELFLCVFFFCDSKKPAMVFAVLLLCQLVQIHDTFYDNYFLSHEVGLYLTPRGEIMIIIRAAVRHRYLMYWKSTIVYPQFVFKNLNISSY